MSEEKQAKKKTQRIKMRQYKHPIKLDGSIIQYKNDGSQFTVEFDGPLPATVFYKYSETLVTNMLPDKNGSLAPGAQLWEVL